MRVFIMFCLLTSTPLRVFATDWFNDDWEDRVDKLSEGELIWYQGVPEKATSHTSLSISLGEESSQHGWVKIRQCHSGLARVPAAQLVFEGRAVRKLHIENVQNIEQSRIEGDSVQLMGVGPGASICVHSEQQVMHQLDSHHWALISGPFQRRFLDAYYPMLVELEVNWPAEQWRYIRMQPATGPVVEASTGHLRMQAHFAGRLKTALLFQHALESAP
jgi:hypothetical protein